MISRRKKLERRAARNRFNLKKISKLNYRLSVFRSNNNISAQVINEKDGLTIASCSTLQKEIKSKLNSAGGANIKAAEVVGIEIAKLSIKKGVSNVYFDRGSYLYHGRIKSLADSARKNGLNF